MSDRAPFLDLSDDQIRDDVVTDGTNRVRQRGVAPSESLSASIWETMAMIIIRVMVLAIRPIARHIDPRVATGFYLRLSGINVGEPWRATARATKGFVHFNSSSGGTVPAGQEIQAGGAVYTTDEELRLNPGTTRAVEVTASTPGASSNVRSGAAVEVQSPEPADLTAELRADWITIYGYDADTEDANGIELYRARVLAATDVRGETNTEARYRLEAIRVPGVSNVKMSRTPRDYGSTDLTFLVRGQLPNETDIEVMRGAIARAGLVCRDIRVRIPDVETVSVVAEITGTATPSEVEAEIGAWWRATIGIGDDLEVQDLYQRAAIGVPGLQTIEYSSPVASIDVQVPTWLSPSISVSEKDTS